MLSDPFSTASKLISNPYVLKIVIETYFSNIHPWIPCIHQSRFEQRLKDSFEGPKLQVLINAMISSTVKHLSAAELNINSDELASLENTARDQAMHSAMGSLSVENMQALIILSFDHVSYIKIIMVESPLTSEVDRDGSRIERLAYRWLSITRGRISPAEPRIR